MNHCGLNSFRAKFSVLKDMKCKSLLMVSGQATALSAFLQMNDLSSDEDDEDTLLVQEERDQYDDAFEKMREQKMRSRQVKAIEELAAAKKKVEDCRTRLAYARDQVSEATH